MAAMILRAALLPENLAENADDGHGREHDDLEEDEAAGEAEHLDAAADGIHAVLCVAE